MDKIHRSIDRVADLIRTQDPDGRAWDFRVGAMHRLFRIFNAPRFRLEPVDVPRMEKQLDALLEWMERVPSTSGGAASRDAYAEPAEKTPERMQFLYGLAWAALSPAEYADAANLLKARIANSNEDLSFIRGATCLDIATGIGRWALAMVQLGAEHVVGFDFSDDCLRGAEERLAPLPERKKIELRNEDLYKLPKDMDEAFDFTCANGVIHHLPDPAGGLKAMAKATKKGGRGFVFVFAGNDAPWWRVIELMRETLAPVPIGYAHEILQNFEVAGTQVFNILDYSYTPIQYKHTIEWYEDALRDAGFTELRRLKGGAIHDSELRSRLFDADRQVYDVSEVRYLLRK